MAGAQIQRWFQRATRQAIVTGVLAGAIGGIAGSIAKIVGELIYEPRTQGQIPPPVLLAERIAGHPLTHAQQLVSTQVIHFIFGAFSGAVYGGLAEVAPIVKIGYGAGFGIVLQLFTHESLVPALGLDVGPLQQPLREHASELFTHILYGATTEAVRRWLRRRWLTAASDAEPAIPQLGIS